MGWKKGFALIVILLVYVTWFFRYDTSCSGSAFIACVSYDRIEGKWIVPYFEARKKENE